ncbi:DUF4369 domain-containing protein [Flavobacterium sp.]|uniref:DUF4369 domain-containing protein n=1 Tax=Flavobacterium sp. TaxID=239 RepID=UPI003918E61D
MKKIILLVAVALVSFACNNLAEGEYIITGNIKGMKTGLIYLEKQSPMGMGAMAIDTVKIEDGKFEIKGKTTEPEIHYIQIDKVDGKIPLVLEGGKINIEVDKDTLFKSKITGTYSNEEFTKFNEESNKLQKKMQSKMKAFETKNKALIEEVQKTRDTAIANKLRAEYEPLQKEAQKNMEDYTFEYPKTHPKSFISVLILQVMMNNPKFTPKEIEDIYNSLDESLKKTKPGKSIKENVDALKKKPATSQP